MLTENRSAFLTALRSGEFTQIVGEWLSNDRPKCCCAGGVAINLSGSAQEMGVSRSGSEIVMSFLNVDEHFVVELICMNDEGKTFGQIADWVEGKWADG